MALTAWLGAQTTPAAGSDPLSVAENQIAALTPGDHDALVFWLSGHGRGPLQAQGATDTPIGIPYFPLDYDVAPAPFPQTAGFLPPEPPIPTPTPAPPQRHRSFLGFLAAAAQLPRVNVPGAQINGPGSLREVNSRRPNCVIDGEGDLDDPSNPFSGAAAVGYAIRQVTFADGSIWREPGANPWPAMLSYLSR